MIAHVVPKTSSEEPPHEIGDGACWCQPLLENDWPSSGRLVTHRRYVDGAVRTPDDDGGWFVVKVGDDVLSPPE